MTCPVCDGPLVGPGTEECWHLHDNVLCPDCDGTGEHVGEACAHPLHGPSHYHDPDAPCGAAAAWAFLAAVFVIGVAVGAILW